MSYITAYHPTKGERRFAAGIWAAMGPDKQGFTERAPMPPEIKERSIDDAIKTDWQTPKKGRKKTAV